EDGIRDRNVTGVQTCALPIFLYIWSVGGMLWLRHFAFPIAFFFVAVPWVTPIEAPIIQGLMRAVARVAAETVTLFGIPTQLEGRSEERRVGKEWGKQGSRER